MADDKVFSGDPWGTALRVVLAPLLTAFAVWLQLRRVLLSEVSVWTNVAVPALLLGGLITAFWALSTEAISSRFPRIVLFVVTMTVLLGSYPGLLVVRDEIIDSAEVPVTGSVVELRKGMRHRRYFVRAQFDAAGATYTTGWINVGRERIPIGGSVEVRYFASDPRVADLKPLAP